MTSCSYALKSWNTLYSEDVIISVCKFRVPLGHVYRCQSNLQLFLIWMSGVRGRSYLRCSEGRCSGHGHCLAGFECGVLFVLLNTILNFRVAQTEGNLSKSWTTRHISSKIVPCSYGNASEVWGSMNMNITPTLFDRSYQKFGGACYFHLQCEKWRQQVFLKRR